MVRGETARTLNKSEGAPQHGSHLSDSNGKKNEWMEIDPRRDSFSSYSEKKAVLIEKKVGGKPFGCGVERSLK